MELKLEKQELMVMETPMSELPAELTPQVGGAVRERPDDSIVRCETVFFCG